MESMKIRWILILLLITVCSGLFSEDFTPGKSPVKAALFSLVLPGAGQFYNESYYKAGTIFLVEGILIGKAIHDHYETEKAYDKAMNSYGDEYEKWADRYYTYYDRRQNDYWWLGITILLSSIDAFVDAHLYNYETLRDDIHLRFEKDKILISWEF